ncbi:hypothetical protein GCM10020220_035800 [Nonomuraea rubra]
MQVGLHHHGEQGLVHAAAAFQQRGEERAGAQLGNLQLQITRGGGQRAGAVPVALRYPGRGALVRGGADHRGQLGLDEGLVDGLGGVPDTFARLGVLQYRKDF